MSVVLPYLLSAIEVVMIFVMILSIVPVLIWMERKGSAYIQDRRGPNRAAILGVRMGGLVHSIADAFKLLTKTDITGGRASRALFFAAPVIAMSTSFLAAATIPFVEPVEVFGVSVALQVANLSGGLIYAIALSSLGVYALLIGGWSSNGSYPFLGALRAAAQVISYALTLGLAAAAIFIVAGSFDLTAIIADQGAEPWRWNAIRQPLTFLLFAVAMFAETNRLPFDLPEGESELVAGYHTEYSSMRFAMFFMGEYAHIVLASLIITAAFLGGWQVPFVTAEAMRANIDATIAVAGSLVGVALIIAGTYMIRRFRRRYGDLRDYEMLVWGLPALALGVGLAVVALYAALGPWTIVPDGAAIIVLVIQLAVVLAKTMLCACIFIWVRWTLPRFRYDQLMRLGWRVLLPLGLINLVITSLVMLVI